MVNSGRHNGDISFRDALRYPLVEPSVEGLGRLLNRRRLRGSELYKRRGEQRNWVSGGNSDRHTHAMRAVRRRTAKTHLREIGRLLLARRQRSEGLLRLLKRRFGGA